MNRRSAFLTTLAVIAAVPLTGCGGEGTDAPAKGSDKAAEVEEPTPPATSAAPASDGRPMIEMPSDVTYAFDWGKTGDPVKDAVLADSEQRIKAVDLAIAEQDALHEAYRFYSEGTAAAGSQRYIQEFVDHKARTTGFTRFYDANVTVHNDGTAALVYCEDQSRAFNKFLETGKTDVTPVTKDSYVVYAAMLRKSENGVWVTERLTSQRGSAECRP
ncbi:hypothetical protein C1708_11990 [Streptomyces sp. DH-12]|uniref:hypothetical protein n=1 Tax=Streptomyces sp. DH-12 TaxID=2072509 RepID=UPI000CCF94D3|nr:hypothetical protein [Streptomyces sp. DH-12]PNV32956.1 hypothetical protein C1708_11990 [Streptomyces sp. DH-12]